MVTFSCKKCGSKNLKTVSEPKSLEDFKGAVCAKCGASVSDNDIKKHIFEAATKIGRDTFGDILK